MPEPAVPRWSFFAVLCGIEKFFTVVGTLSFDTVALDVAASDKIFFFAGGIRGVITVKLVKEKEWQRKVRKTKRV